jgi:type II secretory pathway predicted ATPase ExeA
MIQNYYGLAEEPFGVTPDPRFLYLGTQHREALASLAYGTESNRGFLALIAKPGMGKTSLLYQYLEGLRGKARTAFVFRTDCDSREFIKHLLLDLGIDVTGKDLPAMHDALNQVLAEELRAGKRFVLVIDEAQNLDEKLLESIRLLSNFETPWMKLMQIVIAGQPALAEILSRPSMTQVRQRISFIIRLAPLDRKEINAYIDHRLWVAGCKNSALFTAEARTLIAGHSEGIPRKINSICFNAMSLACALKRKTIERDVVLEVLTDLDLDSLIEEQAEVKSACIEGPMHVIGASHLLAERRSGWTGGWVPKFAVGATLLLAAVIGAKIGAVRAVSGTPRAVNQAQRVDNPIAQPVPSSTEIQPNPVFIDSSRKRTPESVRISEGQTLYHVSVENLGRYNPQVLKQIRQLNPWLDDPDHIRAGQKVVMPSESISVAGAQLPSLQKNPSIPQEVGKQ